jgi:rod shape-determining protein MreC
MDYRASVLRRRSVRALIALAIVIFVMNIVPAPVFRPVQYALAFVAEPFQNFVSWMAFEFRDAFTLIASVSDLKGENESMHRRILGLEAELAELKETRAENVALRQELGLPVVPGRKPVAAEVIARDTHGVFARLRINRGDLDGIHTGLPVVTAGNVFIGRVAEVFPSSAEIELLSSPESTAPAVVAGTSVQGVVRGDHGLGLIFDMALSDEALREGDPVLTSALGDTIPRGLLIGHIRGVRPSLDRLFQQANIVAPVTYGRLRFVTVLVE